MDKPTARSRARNKQLDSDGFASKVESIEQFLRRGGKITKCDPKPAADSISGAFQVDGEICVTALGDQEYIPNYVVSQATYDASQFDQPDALLEPVVRESELQAMPTAIRSLAQTRLPDATEWNGDELYSNYYDEIEPE